MANPRILLVNFDSLVEKSLYELLCRSQCKVECVPSINDALSLLDEKSFHVILTDFSQKNGIDNLRRIKRKAASSEVIILTSYGNLEDAVETIKVGAFDYLLRPAKDEKILSCIKKALAHIDTGTTEKERCHKKYSAKGKTFFDLVGTCPKSQELYSVINRVSNSKATILLHGESGTGKRIIAQAVHKADKKRRHKPFVELSCGALPRDIIESELFGHTKGAFTGAVSERKGRFEHANGGTILLDDIDSLPLDLQAKLLRVLQQKEFERVGDYKTIKVDVRVIVTTNQDIRKAVREKRFREDLYYRIDVISLEIPPLREKKEDLPLLVDHFIRLHSGENHKKISSITNSALRALMMYDWPGNIRQLENILERAIILDTDNVIETKIYPK